MKITEMNGRFVLHLNTLKKGQLGDFNASVAQIMAKRPHTLIINCAELTYLDHQGIKALVNCLRSSIDNGCQLYLQSLREGPRMILEITRTLQLFHVLEEPCAITLF